MSAGAAGRHVVSFLDFFIDVFLEVQNTKSSHLLCLIDQIAYGLHLWYKMNIFKEICRKPISQHPGLGKGLLYRQVWLNYRACAQNLAVENLHGWSASLAFPAGSTEMMP